MDTPLKQILESEGRKLTWLADQVGVQKSDVWRWVHGLHRPVEATQQRIADALGRHVDDVFPPEPDREAA